MTLANVRNPAYARHFLRVGLVVAAVGTASFVAAAPLDEARDAQRAGDAAVIAVLEDDDATRAARLAAVRQAPWLRMPELALESLARIAAGRDPTLAPEAALALHSIATTLDPLTLEAHEVPLDALRPARDALRALFRDRTARADIRELASSAASHLDALSSR